MTAGSPDAARRASAAVVAAFAAVSVWFIGAGLVAAAVAAALSLAWFSRLP